MLQYPIPVFLDSNIFIAAKYDFSSAGIFNVLLNLVKANKIKLYISSVVEGEVKKHINDEVNAFNSKFKKARTETFKTVSESYLTQWSFTHLFCKPDKKQMLEEFNQAFEQLLLSTNAVVLDCTGVDCNQIIEDYFSGNPPFANSDNKRFEFPDAIMISKLKSVFSKDNPIFVISDDNKFREALKNEPGFTTYETLKCIFDLINRENRIYAQVIEFLSQENEHSQICIKIEEAIDAKGIEVDGFDYDRKGICDGYDYDEVYLDSIKGLDFKMSSVDEITVDTVNLTVIVSARISANCLFLDEDNSIWDSEEKEYIFSETREIYEEHEVNYECEIVLGLDNVYEDSKADFEFISTNFAFVLDQETRVNRIWIPENDPAEDAHAEEMDTLEEYYKH